MYEWSKVKIRNQNDDRQLQAFEQFLQIEARTFATCAENLIWGHEKYNLFDLELRHRRPGSHPLTSITDGISQFVAETIPSRNAAKSSKATASPYDVCERPLGNTQHSILNNPEVLIVRYLPRRVNLTVPGQSFIYCLSPRANDCQADGYARSKKACRLYSCWSVPRDGL